jgi:hypothetical protein
LLDTLLGNLQDLREQFGKNGFRKENVYFKNEMTETQNKLDKLLSDYTWEF